MYVCVCVCVCCLASSNGLKRFYVALPNLVCISIGLLLWSYLYHLLLTKNENI